MSFKLTPQAKLRLKEIWNYTFDRWGEDQANKYAHELEDAFVRLAGNVIEGRNCESILPGAGKGLRYYHCGRHYIIYRRRESALEIIVILHDQSQKQFEDFLKAFPETSTD